MLVRVGQPRYPPVRGRRSSKVSQAGVLEETEVSLLRRTVDEYSQSSVLHGVRYLGERGRPWSERACWVVVTLGSVLGSAWFILHTWQHWVQTPVLISFADKPTLVWDIPFPTVTICPSNKYRKRVFDMSKTWQNGRMNLTAEERRLSDDLLLVCRSMGVITQQGVYPSFVDEGTVQNIVAMAPRLAETVLCGRVTDGAGCPWMMGYIMTGDGLCFTYNALPNMSLYRQRAPTRHPVWSLEGGYRHRAGLLELPKRAFGAGLTRGIALRLLTNLSEIDYTCHQMQGFKITLTNPADVPNTHDQYQFVPVTGLTQISVVPHVVDTENELRNYPPSQRHCYFQSERRLAYFAAYTQDNCNLECLTNYTLMFCHCVDFYMPRERSTPVCGFGSVDCMQRAQQALEEEIINDSTSNRPSEDTCDCKPACKSIAYSAEISQSPVELNMLKLAQNVDDNRLENVTINIVIIFLKQSEFFALRRRELYGITSFISNCGGLLGLCCGFSVLSVAELLYFFTLRMWNNARRQRVDVFNNRSTPTLRLEGNRSWY